ncbi:MAG TPA: phosphatidate cytidylyltransferase [Sandaracinaceae bacterium LLY-WYZ-13_1]|nr:phosphatidate cytidylyltransferase [Sandaracinaceae bacterium LLY-WYZ-13_1]
MSDNPEPNPDPASTSSEPPKEKKKGMSNLAVRLLTAAVGIPIILWMLFRAPSWVWSTFALFASGIAGSELAGMTLKGERLLQTWMVVATVAVTGVLVWTPHAEILVALLFGVFLAGPLITLARPDPMEKAGGRMAWLIAGPLYIGGAVGAIGKLHHLNEGAGGTWVVLSMMLAWGSDTGGYFAGRAFGKHKLYEKISPKKTIEGSIGGLVTIVAMALAMHFLWMPELSVPHAITLALVAGAIGQAGDLCVSVIKRSTGVKDSGFIIPGHGGLLDRIDALMFTATVTWLYTRFVLDLPVSLPSLPLS